VTDLRRYLPAIAKTPRRAAISAVLIAGVAAGPLGAGATTAHPDRQATVPAARHTPHQPNTQAQPNTPRQPNIQALTGPAQTAEQPIAPAPNRATTPNHTTTPSQPGAPSTPPAPATPAAPSTPAAPAAPTTPAAPPAPVAPAPPAPAELMPAGTPTDQSIIPLDGEQVGNAQAIIHASKDMNLPPRAAVIAIATSLQETKLHNYGDLGDLNDHDSLGLFQQRPSTGWGTPHDLVDPHYATTMFLKSLIQVPDWQTIPLTNAAQAVQVSAFGDRYAQWEQQAADLVHDNYTH
jgi:hypothetical protein